MRRETMRQNRGGRHCDVCGRKIVSLLIASVYIDSIGGDPTLIAHDLCVPERLDRPGRFYYIGLDRITRRYGDLESLEGWKRHLKMKNWYWSATDKTLDRAHIIAHSLIHHMRGRRRVQPPHSLRARVFERDGFKCRRCGATADEAKLVVDHVQPIARGGTTRIDNLQTLCWDCNSGKRAQVPTDHDLRGLNPNPGAI